MSKIKLALEVVGDLRALAESIETLVHSIEELEEVKTLEETKKKSKKSESINKVEKKIEDAPVLEEITKEKKPTLEEIRALMADKNRDGYREAVKAILNKYGAQELTSLDPSHYIEVLKEVGEIK